MRYIRLFYLLSLLSASPATVLSQVRPGHPADSLCRQAEQCFSRNDMERARSLYEEVLRYDATHLQANIFLGNYYYLRAEHERAVLEDEYRKLTSPTRMQYAAFRNRMSDLLQHRYAQAKGHLQAALLRLPSTEVQHTLAAIAALEEKYL